MFRKLKTKKYFLKKNILKKIFLKVFCSVLKKLSSCCVKPATLPKLEFTFNLNGEALKIHRYPQVTSLLEPSFQLSWRCRVYPCDFVKDALHHWDFLTWVLQDTSLKFGKTFCEVSLPFRLYSRFRFLRISLYLHGDVTPMPMPRCLRLDFQMSLGENF